MHGVIDPLALRTLLERSYTESYRRANIQMTDQEISRQVIADLQLVDSARARGELRGGKGPPVDPNRGPMRPNVIAAAEEETRTKLQIERDESKQGAHVYRPKVLHMNPQRVSERWGYAVARIGRIIQGAGGASTLTGSAKNAAVPKLALEWNELNAFYMTRGRAAPITGVDHNPFRGLSDRDAARVFMRKVEDICDKSSKHFGPWFVPK